MKKAPAKTDRAPERMQVLEAISAAIVTKREEAIAGRANSHIETIWREDDEFYQGFDNANRHEFQSAHMTKPTEGGRNVEPKKRKGSTLFPDITAPYVDMSAAKISDMLMGAADWRPFEVKPTPIPKLLKNPQAQPALGATTPQAMPALAGAPNAAAIMAAPAQAAGMPPQPMAAPPMPAPPPDPLAQLLAKFKVMHDAASQAAERAEDAIDDALVECQYDDEMRKVIHDTARLGTGIIKGPVPEQRKTRAVRQDENGDIAMVIDIELKPVSKRIDPLNLYPDFPACGEDIHNGNFILEFAPATEKQVRALKGGEGAAAYFDEQLDLCLEEGPYKSKTEAGGKPIADGNFPRWYFYGVLKASEIQLVGSDLPENKGGDDLVPVIATLINDRVVKIALNPLEANEFPYDILVWKARTGMPWGIGVARQARVGQRMVTAATRNLMDNAGASARPHKIVTEGIEQDGDPWTWRASSDVIDVRGAMQFFEQPSRQQELSAIIEMGHRRVELDTGLPMTVLGMAGPIQETASGRTILNNNGSTVLRRIARNFDAATEAHVRRYYAWLLLYSEDETVKGDMQIQARGSSSLVERDMQSQQLPMVMKMAEDPANEMSRIKTRNETLKSMHFDPETFAMTDAEKAALAGKPPPTPPIIAVAQIKDAGDTKRAEIKEQGATQRTQLTVQSDAADRVQESHEAELDRQLQLVLGQVKERIESIKDQGAREIAFNDLKAMLAGISIKVQAQRDMSTQDASAHIATHQVMHPPVEPAGRAPTGQGFQK